MPFAVAASRANAALAAVFGVRATYVADAARRELSASPGDVQAQVVPTARGTEVRSTCPWLVLKADLAPILGGRPPKRGHWIEVDDPAAGTQRWKVEYVQSDLVDSWTVFCVQAIDAAVGAKGAEAVR